MRVDLCLQWLWGALNQPIMPAAAMIIVSTAVLMILIDKVVPEGLRIMISTLLEILVSKKISSDIEYP